MSDQQEECLRCGKCCENGGPALHVHDLEKVLDGRLPLEMLITIRKGEYVHHPGTGKVQPAKKELNKIKGKGREWSCINFDKSNSQCSIYDDRPVACVTLQCWNPSESLDLIDRETLTRVNILGDTHPLKEIVLGYDSHFPCPDFEGITADMVTGVTKNRTALEEKTNAELQFRTEKVREHSLSLALELFCFGRPLFQQLQSLGIGVVEKAGVLHLEWPDGEEA